jgi:hypothetical protein
MMLECDLGKRSQAGLQARWAPSSDISVPEGSWKQRLNQSEEKYACDRKAELAASKSV